MPSKNGFRVFATCDIGESLDLLRKRGYEVEVYPDTEPPPKRLIVEKVRHGIDGPGSIGLAMIKRCAGFDMNILCYDPAYQNHDYVQAIQETMDLRHQRKISPEKNWIKYVSFDEAVRAADYVSVHVPLLREGESETPTYHLFNETNFRKMKPTAYLVNT